MMALYTGIIAAIISAVVSIAIATYNANRQKETYRMNIRPYLSIKMEVPPDDGIGGDPVKYIVQNLGNGVAFKPSVTEVFRTINGDVQEGSPIIYPFDYDVILKDSEIVFSVGWEHKNAINATPGIATDPEIMDELVRETLETPKKSVMDNIRIRYFDSLDNQYEQIATIEYNNPDKPSGVEEHISKPARINE